MVYLGVALASGRARIMALAWTNAGAVVIAPPGPQRSRAGSISLLKCLSEP
jgi:hypothetical protein